MRDHLLDIAVVGVSARLPGGLDVERFWSALREGRTFLHRYERETLAAASVPAALLDDPDFVPVRGHLLDAERFDRAFFRMSRRETELTDPQQRLMLEVAWTALEDAAVGPDDERVTAVFASATSSSYLRAMLAHGRFDPSTLDDTVHGNDPDFMASRIAYKLGLTGPAFAVQCACSSSLVAVHLACRAILDGDCDQALVVASGYEFPQAGHLHLPGGISSPTGVCRPFDEKADGVVSGSGVVALVLRAASTAQVDDVEPYGVLLGSATNNDGTAKVGYYAPSVEGQEAVIGAALSAAEVDAASLGYLETHGTGTRVGDPIEWAAASAAFGDAALGSIAVGALKANVGHLDAAAGAAALMKALLVVRDGVVPPLAGGTTVNTMLDTEGSPLYVPREARRWTGPVPRRAGVSSFGIGGTNAHVVVEAPPEPASAEEVPGPHLVLLSAGDPAALDRSARNLAEYLRRESPPLVDVARTLAVGRAVLPERLAVAGDTCDEIADQLVQRETTCDDSSNGGPAPLVFLFPGQGAQAVGMARPYDAALPGFSKALDEILHLLPDGLGERCAVLLRGDAGPGPTAPVPTEVAQPALFALGHAAATALATLGIEPSAVTGHSLGEITAACVAGALDLADAVELVVRRGRAMQDCPPGAMLAVRSGEDEIGALLARFGPGLEVAALNGPQASTVAGTVEAVAGFRERLGDRVATRPLATDRAFHSALIEPALEPIADELARRAPGAPHVPVITHLTGRLSPAGVPMEPRGFVEGTRRAVRFADGLTTLAKELDGALVVEIGPGQSLSALVEESGLGCVALSPASPARSARAATEVLRSLGELWVDGQALDVGALCALGRRRHLPTYPFAGPRWSAPEAGPDSRPDETPEVSHDVGVLPDPLLTTPAAPAPGVDDPRALLGAVWTQVLGQHDLPDDADFFRLGGDSLLITRLAHRLQKELGVRVPVRDLLVACTLGGQAELVRDLVRGRDADGLAGPRS